VDATRFSPLRARSVDQRIFAVMLKERGGVMGRCEYCGGSFPRTRKSRKYCTNRCKTNACLDKKPRLRAADVEALQSVLDAEFPSLEAMRERLRSILAPHQPPIPLVDGKAAVPRLD
jgi:hypothetical protein